MALVVHSLASGSSGNAILARDDGCAVLIDAGIGFRRLVAALAHVGMRPEELSAILITHEHSDHITGAVPMAAKFGIPLVANAPTLGAIPESNRARAEVLDVGAEMTFGNLSVRSFPVSHDAVCPVGYTVSSSVASLCSATDTGYITPEMRAEASQADLLILESNHDEEMLRTGPYPWFLKKRISSEKGHLSNDDADGLLLRLADSGRPVCVWLAHLSKTNNSPSIALASAQHLLYTCLGTTLEMAVAHRDVPSLSWRQIDHHFQLSLFNDRPTHSSSVL